MTSGSGTPSNGGLSPSPGLYFSLTVGLGVEPRGQAGDGPKQNAEFSPEDGLWTSIRHHVDWQTMEADDVEQYQFGGFFARGKLGQGHEVGHLAELVHALSR